MENEDNEALLNVFDLELADALGIELEVDGGVAQRHELSLRVLRVARTVQQYLMIRVQVFDRGLISVVDLRAKDVPGVLLRVANSIVIEPTQDQILNIIRVLLVGALARHAVFNHVVEGFESELAHLKIFFAADNFLHGLHDFVWAQ